MLQEWHDRSYWSVMLSTVPEAAALFCNVSLCFVMLSSPPERFPAANGRLVSREAFDLTLPIWEWDQQQRKWQEMATLPSHTSSSLTPFHWKWMNVSCSVKDRALSSYALEKNPTSFSGFSPNAIEVTIGNVLPDIFMLVWWVLVGLLRTVNTAKKIHTSPGGGQTQNQKKNFKNA